MFDFATNSDVDPALNGRSLQNRPELRRAETGQSSTLGLEMTSGGTQGPSPSIGNFGVSPKLNTPHNIGSITLASAEGVPAQLVSMDGEMELLKFYRYNIAPWLDICDTDQHFGVTLLTELNASPKLRHPVLQLALAASNNTWMLEGKPVNESMPNEPLSGDVASDATEELVASVLRHLAEMVPNLGSSWLRGKEPENRSYLLEKLLLELDSSRLTTCAYWLLIRLGKSQSMSSLASLAC